MGFAFLVPCAARGWCAPPHTFRSASPDIRRLFVRWGGWRSRLPHAIVQLERFHLVLCEREAAAHTAEAQRSHDQQQRHRARARREQHVRDGAGAEQEAPRARERGRAAHEPPRDARAVRARPRGERARPHRDASRRVGAPSGRCWRRARAARNAWRREGGRNDGRSHAHRASLAASALGATRAARRPLDRAGAAAGRSEREQSLRRLVCGCRRGYQEGRDIEVLHDEAAARLAVRVDGEERARAHGHQLDVQRAVAVRRHAALLVLDVRSRQPRALESRGTHLDECRAARRDGRVSGCGEALRRARALDGGGDARQQVELGAALRVAAAPRRRGRRYRRARSHGEAAGRQRERLAPADRRAVGRPLGAMERVQRDDAVGVALDVHERHEEPRLLQHRQPRLASVGGQIDSRLGREQVGVAQPARVHHAASRLVVEVGELRVPRRRSRRHGDALRVVRMSTQCHRPVVSELKLGSRIAGGGGVQTGREGQHGIVLVC
mmetsp:Transcript_62716/g.165976  ORF Transcript_62716/g.165976 Transcript_62716/m.165976 type:complete len:497 (-) Transcript_62716:197-1687(-)